MITRRHTVKDAAVKGAAYLLVALLAVGTGWAIVKTTASTAQVPPCGNGVIDPGEQCDPPGSACGAFLNCSLTCQCTCGNGVIDPGEQCDPPGSSTCGAFVGACGPDCQCPTTTTTVVGTTSTLTTVVTTSTTTLPTCGNGMIDPGEQCDPPGSSTCGAFLGGACGPDCQCCVPQPENTSAACSDMVDNDCDGLIDCADPDCTGIFPCPRASKDPTIITFGRAGLDSIRGHAKLQMAPTDITAMPVGVLLTNPNGAIYSGTLPAGALIPGPSGTIFRFRNSDARTTGGIYSVKIKQNAGGSYTFGFASYADLSAATDPNMRLQFYIGEDANAARDGRIFITIPTPWTRTPHGWRAPKDH